MAVLDGVDLNLANADASWEMAEDEEVRRKSSISTRIVAQTPGTHHDTPV